MKKFAVVSIIAVAFALTACAGTGTPVVPHVPTGTPNSGVIPTPLDRDGNGHLVHDSEKGAMTGQWCHEIDHKYRRIGASSNCVADY